MCGIAGILGVTDPETAEREVRAMIERIAHRGPDGIRVESGPGWCVAHARLSIIDLEGGWQPLHAAGSTIIGNGEIYNYVELTEEFQLKDRLRTGSDFEPLLHIYAQEGEKAFERLRGMYAFCLIGGDGRTWLVRDGFGIKPLYTRCDGDKLYFASEPAALLAYYTASPLSAPEAISELLALGYTLPRSGGWFSAYRAVDPLLPGEATEIIDGQRDNKDFELPVRRVLDRKHDAPPSVEALDAILEDSVRVHQRSDVPYGLFLSGGIDSTAIATLMSRLNERPVTAFTCGFDVPEARDERGAAERVARALNLDWRETTFDEEDFWRIAPQAARFLDEPTTDYACLPTYKLAEAAKGTLTVVLSGEGGDELFGGYGRYRRALRPAWLGGRPAEPQIDAPFLKDKGAGALARWRKTSRPPPGLTPLQRAQYADIATWLPNDLLLKLDRMLMAHGLEGRTPFLDKQVAAFAFYLPDQMKVRGKFGKYILRKWLERHCPAAEPWAKKKGFTVPVAAWIAPRAGDLGPRIAGTKAVADFCDADAVRAVFTDPAQAHNRWPLLFFALWSLIHLEGAEPVAALKSLLGEP
ncbi:asparagine synthase (glutamine-hydrolyzing) [Caulobacter mirabilis]|uniref:asparagine synthase (glutamine-hydrolyzing) n=1 Tax=Caulobacter mirabilis TaxID=69666 RepID=A0A2D2AV76_9CAUL|nr:asparagine synthase (glutamine-hydrolyzing) [Caulobacter mirabilis]ATQ41910.1 asparagine synthase (glutamine-hydrolyzing) [Caulobacter mirabilis]